MKHLTLVALALVPAGLVARPSFDLPDTLYAAPGLECNVYFASSFDSVRPDRFAFETRGNVGKCESARWTWTPKKEDAGKREQVVFNAWTDEGLLTAKTVTVEVAKSPSDTSRKVTCALLADSLTNARYQDRILAVLREKGWANYTPVGSRSGTSAEAWGVYRDGEAAHDGYGGYTAGSFLTTYALTLDEIDNLQSDQEREQLQRFGAKLSKNDASWRKNLLKSPLVQIRGGKKVVDPKPWLDRVNGGLPPDVILIELGVNGGCIQRDEQIVRHVADAKKTFRTLIGELRKVAPKAVVGISTLITGSDQNAFSAYGCSVSSVQCHKNIHAINRGYAELVAEMNAAGDKRIRLVPVGQAIDPYYGYLRAARTPFVHSKEKREVITNALHPSLEGGKQMGDAFAAWLLCELGKDGV